MGSLGETIKGYDLKSRIPSSAVRSLPSGISPGNVSDHSESSETSDNGFDDSISSLLKSEMVSRMDPDKKFLFSGIKAGDALKGISDGRFGSTGDKYDKVKRIFSSLSN